MACWLVVCASSAQDSTNRQFSLGPAPAWVIRENVDFPYANSLTNTGNSEGEEFILVDQQKNALSAQFYNHINKKITSQNGVQNGSRIEIDFDPSYQQLTIHDVHIVRDGHAIDRLDPAKFKVIQQESGLDRHMFNGELSAVLFLEDVRVGDVIDYAYSVTGQNPILNGHFINSFLAQWNCPVHQQRYRVLFPATKRLTVWNHGTVMQPKSTNTAGVLDYRWALDDVAPYVIEYAVPGSVESYDWIQLTDFSSWREVVDWALPLYSIPANAALPDELVKKISVWKQLSPEQQVRNALRFVQDEVRYLGIEIGQYSHRPNPPEVVFARRFGDCKDKAVLLCAILKQLDIEASPVLVDSYVGGALDKWAPSPYAFNHVVARVKLNGRFMWFDPTLAYQRGPLNEIYFPDYSYGLVIAPGTDALTKLPAPAVHAASSFEQTFRYVSYSQPATYEIRSVKRGEDADSVRAMLAGTKREELERSYLNNRAKHFPGIRAVRPLAIHDDEEKNEITIDQIYTLTNEWELSEDKTRYTLTMCAGNIFDFAEQPETTVRTKPLEIPYPYSYTEKIKVFLPETGKFPIEDVHESSSGVRYERKVANANRELEIDYSVETLTNVVATSQLSKHLATLKAIREDCFYYISRPNQKAPHKPSQPNWPIIALAGCFAVISAGGVLTAYRFRPKPSEPPLLDTTRELTGIGGWLVLPMLGLFARFFMVAGTLVQYANVYSAEKWNRLTNPAFSTYNVNYAPLLLFELLWNLANLFLVPLLLVLLFQKRYAFPRYMIVFLILHVVMLGIDEAWGAMIPTAHAANTVGSRSTTMIAATMLWVAYFVKSRRVRNTFVR